jgi:hypothetical protein
MVLPSVIDGDLLISESVNGWEVNVYNGKWFFIERYDNLQKATDYADLLQRRFDAWNALDAAMGVGK